MTEKQMSFDDDDDDDDIDADLASVRGGGARNTDPATSHAAVPDKVGPIASAVLLYMELSGPVTDEWLLRTMRHRYAHVSESSPRKRRGEWVDRGCVKQFGTRLSEFNKDMTVWTITDFGLAYIAAHRDTLTKQEAKMRRNAR